MQLSYLYWGFPRRVSEGTAWALAPPACSGWYSQPWSKRIWGEGAQTAPTAHRRCLHKWFSQARPTFHTTFLAISRMLLKPLLSTFSRFQVPKSVHFHSTMPFFQTSIHTPFSNSPPHTHPLARSRHSQSASTCIVFLVFVASVWSIKRDLQK